jgi:hypothetical protein
VKPLQPDKPVFRKRKKKFQGATWTPETKSADKPDGVWCGYHKLRHGYMSKELGFSTERYNSKSYIHWYCKKTGDVLDTVQIGGTDGPRIHGSDGESGSSVADGSGDRVRDELQE